MMPFIIVTLWVIIWYFFVRAFLDHVATTQFAYAVPTLTTIFVVCAFVLLAGAIWTLFRIKGVYRKMDKEYQRYKKIK